MSWLACLLVAHAGDLVAEVAVDSLTATGRREGADPDLASELGMRVRADLSEVDDRLGFALDYRGREPLVGDNSTKRLLYAAVLDFALVEDRFSLGLGRFLAPSAVLLPVDGLRAQVSFDRSTSLSVFGGRRGFSTSRVNLGFERLLPATGLSFDRLGPKLQLQGLVAWAGDEVNIAGQTTDLNGLNALARTVVVPSDAWVVGAQLSFAQQASYVLGPTWADIGTELRALDWFTGLVYAYYSPKDFLRFDADVHHQSVQAFFAGTVEGDTLLEEVQEPNHTDVRLRAGVAPWERGWLRLEGRFRRRPDRRELRLGVRGDLDDLGIPGLLLRGRLYVDGLSGTAQADDVGTIDRLFWSASTGWRGQGLEAETGVSFVERAASPLSGRTSTLSDPGAPTDNVDLAPFVLEAQNIVFLRGFYTHRRWFVGADLEANLNDREIRAFLQVGVLGDLRW